MLIWSGINALVVLYLCADAKAFDINDPKTNLDCFVRTSGSKNSNASTVGYFNGTVYERQPYGNIQRLLNFEGYNINRKVPQLNGSYLSLSLEFVVYRDPITSEILRIFINPITNRPNEVFYVANNPVNALLRLGDIFPTQTIPNGQVVFNADIILEYPNVLDPAHYANYSAGTVYDAAELFAYFSNLTTLSTVKDVSVGYTGTWIRKSQYLPWLEMGDSPGNLFYTTLVWKCHNGIDCIAKDILDLVKAEFPEYLDAPLTYEVPNETSWTRFKNTVDQRRQAGQPDIIIPDVNISTHARTYSTSVDEKILNLIANDKNIGMYFNGSAYSEITGSQSVKLFNIEGAVTVSVSVSQNGDSYTVQINGAAVHRDASSGHVIRYWKNPLTGKTVRVPTLIISTMLELQSDLVYSIDITESQSKGLIVAHSSSSTVGNREKWSVNLADLIFDNTELDKTNPRDVYLYGTWGSFSSWPGWMGMSGVPGNIVMKATVHRIFSPPEIIFG